MSVTDQRKEGSTTNPSRKWQRDLGMDTPEELLRQLRAPAPPKEEVVPQTGAFDRAQVIELCKVSLNFLAGLAMPDVFLFHFPPTHLTAWQILVQSIDGPKTFPQIALGIPRGHAKTTLIKLFILFCILYTKKKFILVTASTEQHAINILSDVVDMLDEPNVKAVFGDFRNGMEMDTKALRKFGFRGRNITLAAVGAEGALRGLNVKNLRPDLMVFDDIQTKECAFSKVQSTSLEEWMIGTAMKAKSPSGCMFIFAGNMFPTPHSILKKLKANPAWIKFISGAILADGSALWPELRPIESLLEELDNDIAMGHPEIFFSEVLNDTEAGINSQVDFSTFGKWRWTEHDLPQGKFLTIDPSQGKGLDSDVIMRWEVYDGQLAVVEILEEHLSPGNLIRKALVMALKTRTALIAVESMAYQYTLLYWFEEVCKTVGISGITFVPLYAINHSKNSRIQAAIKSLESKEIILHPSVVSIVQKQIADWNPMKRDNVDDILDTLANGHKVLAEYAWDIQAQESIMVLEVEGAKVDEDNGLF